jgi:toluene monooxygenase system protein E
VTQKTYWHLLGQQRKPSDYDIGTSRLLYYPERGFEVKTPLDGWYQKNQRESLFRCADWEAFRDPRELTYTRYVDQQRRKEIFVDGLFASIDATGYDQKLSPSWVALLERVLPPLRYPVHGLQMIAAYLGSMAPSGKIVVTAGFQAGDEMRRIQRLAYRMRQLQETRPDFGASAKSLWQEDPMWQPLRELVERLMATYDWGESFVVLQSLVKPAFDELFMVRFASRAGAAGDETWAKISASLAEDCAWHREWSSAVIRLAERESRAAIDSWSARWRPLVDRAMAAFQPIFE